VAAVRSWDAAAVPLAEMVESLTNSSSLEEMEQKYLRTVRGMIDSPAVGLYLLSPFTGRAERLAASGVSDYFLSRYEEAGRDRDPVLHYVLENKTATHNRLLMPVERWCSLGVYDEVFRLHRMVNLLQAPVISDGRVLGTLNFGGGEGSKPFGDRDVGLAAAIGRLLGVVLESMRAQEDLRQEREHLIAGLELCDEAVVLTDVKSGRRRLNAAARRILDLFPGGQDASYIDDLMAKETREGDLLRVGQCEAQMTDGRCAVLRLRSTPMPENPRLIVSFLTLHGADTIHLPAFVERALAPREREVARLVALGLKDKEIADRLLISPFTVKQYLKNTYRKLSVRSRVDLTRILTERNPTPPKEGIG
jgi:DNA-binding CsgD family transcriptional regulator/GAF domain-containing protein